MQLSFYSKITTLTSMHSRAGCYLPLQHLSLLLAHTEGEDSHSAGSRILLFQIHPQDWAVGHAPHMQQWDSHHWMSSAGTWGTRLLWVCAELWDLAMVCVSYKVKNRSESCVRLGVFISYCSFF